MEDKDNNFEGMSKDQVMEAITEKLKDILGPVVQKIRASRKEVAQVEVEGVTMTIKEDFVGYGVFTPTNDPLLLFVKPGLASDNTIHIMTGPSATIGKLPLEDGTYVAQFGSEDSKQQRRYETGTSNLIDAITGTVMFILAEGKKESEKIERRNADLMMWQGTGSNTLQ